MLELTRKNGESLIIGDEVVVTYLGTNKRGQSIIGVSAPKSVPVDREEVRLRKQQQAKDRHER